MNHARHQHRDGRLAAAHVAVIGVGGLGCPAALTLAAAEVGTMTLVDPDRVELSNLPRQLLHGDADLGRLKVDSAAEKLRSMYPGTRIRTRPIHFERSGGAAVLAGVDVAIDATDGIEAKLAINDVAVDLGVPFCHAGVLGLGGQVMLVVPGATPCLRCVFPGIAEDGAGWETCRQAGIVGPVAGLIGALQANLAVSHLRGAPGIAGVLVSYDRRADRWRRLGLTAAPPCPRCANAATPVKGKKPASAS